MPITPADDPTGIVDVQREVRQKRNQFLRKRLPIRFREFSAPRESPPRSGFIHERADENPIENLRSVTAQIRLVGEVQKTVHGFRVHDIHIVSGTEIAQDLDRDHRTRFPGVILQRETAVGQSGPPVGSADFEQRRISAERLLPINPLRTDRAAEGTDIPNLIPGHGKTAQQRRGFQQMPHPAGSCVENGKLQLLGREFRMFPHHPVAGGGGRIIVLVPNRELDPQRIALFHDDVDGTPPSLGKVRCCQTLSGVSIDTAVPAGG